MNTPALFAFALGSLAACAPAKAPSRTQAPRQRSPAPPACPGIDPARGEAAFERAKPFLELLRHEEHPRIEDWNRGVADLREAAENGNLEGQARYGNTVLGFIYTDHAPEASDRADMVSALTWLRVAALRGHAGVIRNYPGIDVPRLAPSVRFEQPLGDLPRTWLIDAFHAAERFLTCAPQAAKSRYLAPPARETASPLEKGENGWTRAGDPEGPLLRITFAAETGASLEPPLTTRLLGALPAWFDCYRARLARDPDSHVALSLRVELSPEKITIEDAHDEKLAACFERAVSALALPSDAQRAARIDLEIHPRALSAPELPEAGDPSQIERWKEDGSCWGPLPVPPCPANKKCPAPERARVKCE